MKQPKLSDVRINLRATKILRDNARAAKRVKITINLDEDLIIAAKGWAAKTGVPYQVWINRVLREAITKYRGDETRLDCLERVVARLQKRLAA